LFLEGSRDAPMQMQTRRDAGFSFAISETGLRLNAVVLDVGVGEHLEPETFRRQTSFIDWQDKRCPHLPAINMLGRCYTKTSIPIEMSF
jgi:hypothetical protein